MHFSIVAETFDKLESTSGRLEMTDILAKLFKKTSPNDVQPIAYFIQGILSPPYEGIDLGMGERFAIESIASAAGYSKKEVEDKFKKLGDLGKVAEEYLSKKQQRSLSKRDITVNELYSNLIKIAKSSGTGSQELKRKYLVDLLNNANPLESRFIVRFVIGDLRLGVGDPTILDALSVFGSGDKSLREELERAYNVCADLGLVAKTFFESPKTIKSFKVQPFKPLMPALAERLSSSKEIIAKLGECAVERKYDGLRLQVHKNGNEVEIYSRKLEKMTHMFPDIVEAVQKLKLKELIFEGEALAYNNKQKRYFSFQETMHRRRKHGIEKSSKELPLNLFVFDLLYDGKDLTEKPYSERRKKLEKIFPNGPLIQSEMEIVKDSKKLEKIFLDSMNQGLEGIMAKDLSSPYTAGKRKFAWIKLKKSYGLLVDTIDALIVGYYLGKGSRTKFKFGGLLTAVYNNDSGKFETIAKIGSGFTEDEMQLFEEKLNKITTSHPPANLEFKIKPDFWVKEKYVVEVAFDEITLSPTHTCGLKQGKGYALRFPRIVQLRDDRAPKDSTTTKEVADMYWVQHKGK